MWVSIQAGTRTRLVGLAFAMSVTGCAADTQRDVAATSAQLCGAEPIEVGDRVAGTLACPFEQQYHNIVVNGEALKAPEHLVSESSQPGVMVTHRCNEWLLGTDTNGVAVFINVDDGSVLSHGLFHSGQATSTVPTKLPLPISLRQ